MSRSVSAVALIARRFLVSKSSDGFLSLIAWVSVVGVALGVLALVVVTSVINGFEGELARAITGMHGDVVLYVRPGADPISEPEVVSAKVRKLLPDLKAMTQSFVTEVMASGQNGVAGSVLEGDSDGSSMAPAPTTRSTTISSPATAAAKPPPPAAKPAAKGDDEDDDRPLSDLLKDFDFGDDEDDDEPKKK